MVRNAALTPFQGEAGDAYYMVLSGSARVLVDGREVGGLQPGDAFGEIALLHDVPRTATVVADGVLELCVIDRESFSAAVDGRALASLGLV